ncbi:MAG: short-chain dehydrogenase [Alphaproteobacteria bacterium]|nr:short-chain dehydrogenase [Alphaproteobacteria bacterium]|tara:strand:- start:878 stop:1645 length:768 start_codon:yes stop_codon:yes gene_type:complete
MSMPFDLSDKTAIVTGSTKGIGRAIAVALAEAGANVTVSSRDTERVAETEGALADAGHKVLGIPCNVGRKAELQSLVDGSRAKWGPADILVCNAAINPYYGPSMEIPDNIFAKIMQTNIQSQLWLTQMVVPDMQARKDGAIVLVSSIGGLRGSDVIGAYNISKAADIQLAKNLAVELGPNNIRVNAIAPGLVKTDFARALWENPEFADPRITATPMRRLGDPEDIAGAAVFLASGAASWVTGQTLVIDGGATVPV